MAHVDGAGVVVDMVGGQAHAQAGPLFGDYDAVLWIAGLVAGGAGEAGARGKRACNLNRRLSHQMNPACCCLIAVVGVSAREQSQKIEGNDLSEEKLHEAGDGL